MKTPAHTPATTKTWLSPSECQPLQWGSSIKMTAQNSPNTGHGILRVPLVPLGWDFYQGDLRERASVCPWQHPSCRKRETWHGLLDAIDRWPQPSSPLEPALPCSKVWWGLDSTCIAGSPISPFPPPPPPPCSCASDNHAGEAPSLRSARCCRSLSLGLPSWGTRNHLSSDWIDGRIGGRRLKPKRKKKQSPKNTTVCSCSHILSWFLGVLLLKSLLNAWQCHLLTRTVGSKMEGGGRGWGRLPIKLA